MHRSERQAKHLLRSLLRAGADVDIVTKATGSSTMFKQAVERALLKADPTQNSVYFDGVFLGRSHWIPTDTMNWSESH